MEVLGLLAFMMPLYGLAVWVFTAWMSGHVAEQKGAPFRRFMLWGLLFGPLALLAAVGLPDRRQGGA